MSWLKDFIDKISARGVPSGIHLAFRQSHPAQTVDMAPPDSERDTSHTALFDIDHFDDPEATFGP